MIPVSVAQFLPVLFDTLMNKYNAGQADEPVGLSVNPQLNESRQLTSNIITLLSNLDLTFADLPFIPIPLRERTVLAGVPIAALDHNTVEPFTCFEALNCLFLVNMHNPNYLLLNIYPVPLKSRHAAINYQ